MITTRMMETSIDNVVHVIAMRDRLMSAPGAMNVAIFVFDVGHAGAAIGVLARHGEHVLVDRTIFVLVMEMTVVEIIDVIAMPDGRMSAARAMLVGVLFFRDRLCARA